MPSFSDWRSVLAAGGLASSIVVAAPSADTGCAVFTDLGTDGYTNGEAGAGATHCDAEAGCTGGACSSAAGCEVGDVCCASFTGPPYLVCQPVANCTYAICSTNIDCGDGGTCVKQVCSTLGSSPVSACSLLPTCTPLP